MAKFDLSAGQNELASIDEEEAGQVWSLTDFFYFWTIGFFDDGREQYPNKK